MCKNRRGFTLIELLVVIAIIAILAAILFPVFTSAKDTAKKAACMSNTRQLNSAFMLYCQNFSDALPVLYRTDPNDQNVIISSWPKEIFPYVKNEKTFLCPSRPNGVFKSSVDNASLMYMGYGYNFWYLGNTISGVSPGYKGIVISKIKSPSKTVIITDSLGRRTMSGEPAGPYGKYIWSCIAGPSAATQVDGSKMSLPYVLSDAHGSGVNVAWCDGHTSWAQRKVLNADDSLWDLK